MPPVTKEIAIKWLAQVRGARPGQQQAGGLDISDDDSSSDEDRDHPVNAGNQRTIEIAHRWLSTIRPTAPQSQRRLPIQVLDIENHS